MSSLALYLTGSVEGIGPTHETRKDLELFGGSWSLADDNDIGGESYVDMQVLTAGAHHHRDSIVISGFIEHGIEFPWAGAIFSPGGSGGWTRQTFTHNITFRVRGDGRTYRLMLFTGTGPIPPGLTFASGSEWKQYTFALAQFSGGTRQGATQLTFAGGPDPGPFRFEIGDIHIR